MVIPSFAIGLPGSLSPPNVTSTNKSRSYRRYIWTTISMHINKNRHRPIFFPFTRTLRARASSSINLVAAPSDLFLSHPLSRLVAFSYLARIYRLCKTGCSSKGLGYGLSLFKKSVSCRSFRWI